MYTPTTLLALVEQGLPKNVTPATVATKRDGKWIETSRAEFERQVELFAYGLHDLGVRRGDRVALHAENSAEWLIADLAVLSLGAVDVPIYTTQPADQIQYILENSEAVAYIVSSAKLHQPVASILPNVATLKATVGIRGSFAPGMLSWQEVLARGEAAKAKEPGFFRESRAQAKPDDLATLIYTSGTTGTPKGVMLTHWNLASNVLSSLERMPWDIEGERGGKILSYLPLSHVFERMLGYLYLHVGYPIWFVENFEEMLADLAFVTPVHFSSVPRLLEKVYAAIHARVDTLSGAQKKILAWGLGLADRFDVEKEIGLGDRVQYAIADALVFKKLRALFGGNLKAITSGGAALSKEVMNFINAIGIFCGQGYGLSETSPVITVYEKDRLRAGSVGSPISGVEIRIAGDGEIWVRGPNVMEGYFRAPEATAEVMEDGWFKTGDIGVIDGEGFLTITDRKKEMMKLSTGKYIAPQPIEQRLAHSRFIDQVVVIGNSRQFCSALLVVSVDTVVKHFAETGQPLAKDADVLGLPQVRELIQREVDAVNAHLPHWEQVKKFALVKHPWSIETGELTPTMKIKRRVINERHADDIQTLYA
ncbi:long-chain fatty acid--CoA ligase [Longimicrobium sp.]|uniref:AMP-dependent synthetase/ligase n=1 Tax=Longimicrobium sp. TaxID=2029185 RepID=UPI002B71A91B|nr:long-chain fatty acid--CoA ligase [Longimicrobium sp.]HSU17228.1 long-chain fatty acid--CoA ligase [Longimicrobium sp.]